MTTNMRMSGLLFSAAVVLARLWLFPAISGSSQGPGGAFLQSQAVQSENVVKSRAALSVDRAKPGLRFELAVIAEIADGYHINANKPSDEFLIGTELTVEAPPEFQPAKPLYPPPQMRTYPYAQKPLAVYEKQAVIKVPLSLSRNVKSGSHILKARLRFQPCSEKLCLPPKQMELEIPVEVVPSDQPVKRINRDVFGSGVGSKRPSGR